ncbi:histidine kinase [Halorarius litoreus]|uniref:histidine kinase n=1 Tax=Halorarius litoreus TaxID=2962676 RepID=UPI0020CE5386|nr:histidine kinase [Halorarius litoreus]
MSATQLHVGLICSPEHTVFQQVTEELQRRGLRVTFFEPGVALSQDTLADLDLLVNKKPRFESVRALEDAERLGVATWNDPTVTRLFINRLSHLGALEAVGFTVPETHLDCPDGEYVAKRFFDVEDTPELNGEGDLYQPLLPFDGIDHKYYAVDDGDHIHTAVTLVESKLFGDRTYLRRGTVDPVVDEGIRRLIQRTGVRALGVDVVYVDDEPVAIDANVATSFRHADLETPLIDSIERSARGWPGADERQKRSTSDRQ